MTLPELDRLVEEIAASRLLQFAAAQMLQLVEDEPFAAHELAQAISSDPSLNVRILRLANSPFFAFPFRVATPRDAVTFLGFRQVRATALAVAAMDALADGPHPSEADASFWRHAITTALVAVRLAEGQPRFTLDRHNVPADQVFLAGFMHSIGRLALSRLRATSYRQACVLAETGEVTLHQAQEYIFGFTDAEVGGALLLRWGFPADLALAVGHGADPDLRTAPTSAVTPQQRLARLVTHAADLAAAPHISTCDIEPGELYAAQRRADAFMDVMGIQARVYA